MRRVLAATEIASSNTSTRDYHEAELYTSACLPLLSPASADEHTFHFLRWSTSRTQDHMRLLKLDEHGEPVLAKDYRDDSLPPYAILSHTWYADDQEVTFGDITSGAGKNKSGFEKIRFCAQQAQKDGLAYFWVDSCCIDKSNSVELSEAIISMFRWYKNAERCYVFLTDVSGLKRDSDGQERDAWEGSFRSSKWHRRGWTLQELIAPKHVSFYTRDCHWIGDKSTMEGLISDITRIPVHALRGAPLGHFPIDERLRWAADRQTTRIEDKAYCLFGMFNVVLPQLYGEGDYALVRLKEAVERHGNTFDHTLLTSDASASVVERRDKPSVEEIQDRRRDKMTALRFEQMDARRSTVKDAQPTTCEWFLEHPIYMAWNNSSVTEYSHRIMWINGKPGAGKSTLVKYAFAKAQKNRLDNDILLSFFFNARGDELEKVTEGLYRTLLLQLLSAVPVLQQVLDDAYPFAPTSEQQFSWTLQDLQRTFADAVTQLGHRRLKCFIDALDECEERQIRDMVDFFEDLVERNADEGCQLLVCFASRHYPTIHIEHGQRLILENETGHDEDMAKYIKRHLRAGSGKALREIHEQIQEKANGVFLWAVLVVDMLKKELERGRMFALKKRVQEMPEGLSELFREILRRDHVNMDDLLLCLQWILFAKSPLKREEFYFAMAAGLDVTSEPSPVWKPKPWDPEDVTVEDMTRFVLNASKGLAELTKAKPHTVQFIHESVRDFLLRDGGLSEIMPDPHHNFPSSAHEKLKICCQNYLVADLSHIVSFDEPLPKASSDPAKKLREDVKKQFPFLEYACKNVLYHADEAALDISQTNFLTDFKLTKWLDVTNLLESAEIRRHSRRAKLLYVLAEQGLSRLITILSQHEYEDKIPETLLFDMEQRYGHALIAAFANGHLGAVKALLPETYPIPKDMVMKDPDFGKANKGSYLHKGESLYTWGIRTRNVALAVLKELTISSGRIVLSQHLFVFAIDFGRLDILESLLIHGTDPDGVADRDGFQNTLIEHGIRHKKNSIQLWLKYDARTIAPLWAYSQTPLMYASMAGLVKIVDLLLRKGADIYVTDDERQTALALSEGHEQDNMMGRLLTGSANIDAVDGIGRTCLKLAASAGHTSTVETLLKYGANINAADERGRTCLHLAASAGDASTVETLLKYGANVDAADVRGRTCLQLAASVGYTSTVETLLKYGANTNAADERGRTCLHLAASAGYGSTVETLLKHGAFIEAVDWDYRRTPLICAVAGAVPASEYGRVGNFDTLQFLLQAGANINAVDKDNWTALFYAVQLRWTSAVECLLANGADVRTLDSSGCTALFYELRMEYELMVPSDIKEVLLSAGAALVATSSVATEALDCWNDLPALHYAAKLGMHSKLDRELSIGSDVNSRDSEGYTALMHAVAFYSGQSVDAQVKTVQLLLDARAEIDAVGSHPAPTKTALGLLACQPFGFFSTQVVHMLFRAGAHMPGLTVVKMTAKTFDTPLRYLPLSVI